MEDETNAREDSMKTIVICTDFTDAPGGRFVSDGESSGEDFRARFLVPAMNAGLPFCVDLDGTFGYATSFLEEAFGGLARDFGSDKVLSLLKIKSDEEPDLINRVIEYIKAN